MSCKVSFQPHLKLKFSNQNIYSPPIRRSRESTGRFHPGRHRPRRDQRVRASFQASASVARPNANASRSGAVSHRRSRLQPERNLQVNFPPDWTFDRNLEKFARLKIHESDFWMPGYFFVVWWKTLKKLFIIIFLLLLFFLINLNNKQFLVDIAPCAQCPSRTNVCRCAALITTTANVRSQQQRYEAKHD